VKILIDALTAREGGGVTYLRQILPAFRRAAPENEYHVLLSSRYQQPLIDELSSHATVAPVELSAGNLPRRLLFLGRDLPRRLVDGAYDVLFTVNEVGCIRPTRPHVMLARNYSIFAPLDMYPKWSTRTRIAAYRLTREPVARIGLRRATHVAFVSETYRRTIVQRLRLAEWRTSVVHHGIDRHFSRVGAQRILEECPDDGYVLCVSSLAPHKNFEILLRGYAASVRQTSSRPLLIAGAGVDTRYGLSLRELVRSLGIEGDVRFLGRVKHEALPQLYRGAMYFVFPSRLETFGQPLLEAMATATPIVASDSSVAREICGGAAVYFNASSSEELADCLTRVSADAALRRRLALEGEQRARNFSWTETARQTLMLLAQAASGR
jgi:glycosyltransferase involved in cell wall biosynthesis